MTGTLFMDLSKAFDTVHHGCILEKRPCYGIDGHALLWFTDYLFNRDQVVTYEGSASSPCKITHGVPQGSILGPQLFSILINDIYLLLNESNIIL